jgi:ADP-heptose:LPS heptosyltransferase
VAPSDPRRILILRLSHLGDVAHALGLLHALHAAYPRAAIAWAVQPEFAPLVAPVGGLDHVIPFERRGGARAWLDLARGLAAFDPDWAVDVQGNLKSALASVLSNARRRVGLAPADWQERWASGTVAEHAAPAAGAPPHALDRVEALVRHLVPGFRGPLRTDPDLTATERDAGRRWLARTLPGDDPPVLLHLSSSEDVRGWPEEHWTTLVDALARTGRSTLVLSGPAEEAVGRALASVVPARPGLAHCVGQRGLRQLCGLLAAAAERGGTMVACDSGPMHLAWSCGLRVCLLEGPQDARRTGPWPVQGRHLRRRAPAPPDCAPCRRRSCVHERGPVCMTEIAAEDVLTTLAAAGD